MRCNMRHHPKFKICASQSTHIHIHPTSLSLSLSLSLSPSQSLSLSRSLSLSLSVSLSLWRTLQFDVVCWCLRAVLVHTCPGGLGLTCGFWLGGSGLQGLRGLQGAYGGLWGLTRHILYRAFASKGFQDFGWKFLGKVDAAFAWMFSLCPSSLS